MKRRILSVMLVCAVTGTMILSGCQGESDSGTDASTESSTEKQERRAYAAYLLDLCGAAYRIYAGCSRDLE